MFHFVYLFVVLFNGIVISSYFTQLNGNIRMWIEKMWHDAVMV